MEFSKESIFTEARSHKKFTGAALTEKELKVIYEQMKYAPTANNSCPLRIVFANSERAIQILANCALDFNKGKTRTAPTAAILGYDMNFFEQFKCLSPHMKQPAAHASWPEERRKEYALANANIQTGFFIAAARSLGYDCGPLGGFNQDAVESNFFAGTHWKFNSVVLLGQGDHLELRPRAPRLDFSDACRVRSDP